MEKKTEMDISEYNRNAWNLQSQEGCRWSTPFSDEIFAKAKEGEWSVCLTPTRSVPDSWFPSGPDLTGVNLLGLASGGGQQVPIFAAAGANVTSFDNSDVQLEKDKDVCESNELNVRICQGDMADLSELEDEQFDLIFNPVSNAFAPDLEPIWRECVRILKPGGKLMCGMMNPAFYLFDHEVAEETGELEVKYRLPYSDFDSSDAVPLSEQLDAQLSLEYSHSWETQLGGQCQAGLAITGFYEDTWDDESTALNKWFPVCAATCAVKL